MIKIILFLYAILNVTMAAFTVTSDDPDYFLATQNAVDVTPRGHHPLSTQQNLEEENHHLRSTVDYLGRTVDRQYHTIEEKDWIIAQQQEEIGWLRRKLEQARWEKSPLPVCITHSTAPNSHPMKAPPPYGSDFTADDPRGESHPTEATSERSTQNSPHE